jgi:hypothetical protein
MEAIARVTRCPVMRVFLDFEASSLSDQSYPIEVGWVFEDGVREAHLIRPAPQWTEWDPAAETIHRIPRELLLRDGRSHDLVAARMVEALSGHDLYASAPSWDGKWLSALLRAAGIPRHALRLRGTDEALEGTAREILSPVLAPPTLAQAVEELLTLAHIRRDGALPAHRALADAEQERERWLRLRSAAQDLAARAEPGRCGA